MGKAYHGPRADQLWIAPHSSFGQAERDQLVAGARFGIPGLVPQAPDHIERHGGEGDEPGERVFHLSILSRAALAERDSEQSMIRVSRPLVSCGNGRDT